MDFTVNHSSNKIIYTDIENNYNDSSHNSDLLEIFNKKNTRERIGGGPTENNKNDNTMHNNEDSNVTVPSIISQSLRHTILIPTNSSTNIAGYEKGNYLWEKVCKEFQDISTINIKKDNEETKISDKLYSKWKQTNVNGKDNNIIQSEYNKQNNSEKNQNFGIDSEEQKKIGKKSMISKEI